ncbi:tetratricopeptide repeat protein [Actinoplanes sp. Pm04-4]|uniref:Tetratricopeptide repeat protein n=1 Tax=Paractinoplanes pyxinae TaxID=2997416 RepID=A0ABT4B8F4_9ACTN|nr:tetratricopeptide repeat protein [Actinoplanes pyxinae]MCY1142794.1 tetratricopeptide repeat protein [Actinoplanes pyxinae]
MTIAHLGVLTGVLLLVLVVPLAAIIAAAQPVPPPRDLKASALPGDRSTATLRPLPDGLPAGTGPVDVAALRPPAVAALGPDGAAAFERLLRAETFLQDNSLRDGDDQAVYPYRYPAMTRLLDAAPGGGRTDAAVRLGAALIRLRALNIPGGGTIDYPAISASAAAYALLERGRETGDCAAQLNLLLLVAADELPRDEVVREEAARAEKSCPDDPTPLWIHGQYLSQRAHRVLQFDGEPAPREADDRATAVFTRLSRRFPGSLPALTGAADNDLRAGLRLLRLRPFTARERLRAAAEGYLAAYDLDPIAAGPGLARALIALGEPRRAAETVRRVMRDAPHQGPLLELLTTAEEEARRHGPAASAARTLARLGDGAYPTTSLVFPVPGGIVDEADREPVGPQSTGVATHLPITVDLQFMPGGAGGDVEDLAFIPAYRESDTVGADPDCPGFGWRRDAILAGQIDQVLASFPTTLPGMLDLDGKVPRGYCRLNGVALREIARLEQGRPTRKQDPDFVPGRSRDDIEDARQNLFRWAGDLPRAEEAIRSWTVGVGPADPLPRQRLGEVLFLRGRYEEAASAFDAAARKVRAIQWDQDLLTWRMHLNRGASLLRTARLEEGLALLRTVADDSERAAAYWRQQQKPDLGAAEKFALLCYHAHAQIADAERTAGRLHSAVDNYTAAHDLLPHLPLDPAALRPERLDANQSLAEIGLGRFDAAAQSAARALQADPANPVFLMNAGFAAERAGRYEAAARYDAQALVSDPGAFPAANDLGVALARLGHEDEAVAALRRSVGARPDYALGWFNLGVVYGRMGPLRFLHSQGALARAFALDAKLREAPRQPTTDVATYRSGLDLSKPLPPRWSLAGLPPLSPGPATGVLAVLVLGLTLARAAGAQGDAQQWLEAMGARAERHSVLSRLRSPFWAVAATALIFGFSAGVRGRDSLVETLGLILGVLVLTAVVLQARRYAARRADEVAEQSSWGPGIAFGAVTAVLAPWAPLPVIRPAATAPRVHAAAPLALGLAGMTLYVEAAAFPVPIVRALATAAVIMVASLLVPVAPLDGAQLSRAGLLAGAGALGAVVLLGLGVV